MRLACRPTYALPPSYTNSPANFHETARLCCGTLLVLILLAPFGILFRWYVCFGNPRTSHRQAELHYIWKILGQYRIPPNA